jgi:hypothetical protein
VVAVTSKSLWKAGLLALANAALSIPFFILSSSLETTDDLSSIVLLAVLQLLGLAIFTYLVLRIKSLMNGIFNYHGVDDYIDFIVVINIFFCIARLSKPILYCWKAAVDLFSLLMLIALGVAQILFGLRLLQASDSLKGELKFFGAFTLAAGILATLSGLMIFGGISGYIRNSFSVAIISLIMVLLALIAGSIRDVFLGAAFFRFARRIVGPEKSDDKGNLP